MKRYGESGGGESGGGRRGWGASVRASGSASDRIRAGDIMTEQPTAVTPETTLQEAAHLMEDLDVGILPVVADREGRRLSGVITDRDIAVRAVAHGRDGKTAVAECMTPRVSSVRPDSTVHEVLNLMKREQVRRVPVCDEEGRLVGIIAQADLAVHYAGLDLERETEVEEMIERVSEPARPRWHEGGDGEPRDRHAHPHGLGERVREGWEEVKERARDLMGREDEGR
jgi:CBS domain-containing protein